MEEGMIQKHLNQIKELGFYYELVHLLDLQRKLCLDSIMKTDFYLKHKNGFLKSYILAAPMPEEIEQWKNFKPNKEQDQLAKATHERDELKKVLSGILKDPTGCPMCDSGILRDPEKQHWPECLFYQAENLLNNETNNSNRV